MSARRPPVAPSRARFEHRAARVRRRPLRLALAALLVLALLAGLTWVVAFSPLLAASSVRVEGVDDADSAAVLDAAAVPLGTPLARLDTAGIAQRVHDQVRFVNQVSVRRAWPQTVVLDVAPRAAVLVEKDAQDQLSLVDATGNAFRVVEKAPEGLPVVSTTDSADREGLLAAVEVLTLLSESQRATVKNLTVSSADLVSFSLGKVTVVWGGRGDGAKKLAVLNALLTTNPAVVDVSAPDTPVTR